MKHTTRITVTLLLLCGIILSGCQTNSNDTSANATTPEQSVTAPQESGETAKSEDDPDPVIQTVTDIPGVTGYEEATGTVISDLELSSGVELKPFKTMIRLLSSYTREHGIELHAIRFDGVSLAVTATDKGLAAVSVTSNDATLTPDTPIDILGEGENDRCFSIVTSQYRTVVSTENGLRHYFLENGKVTLQDFSGNTGKDFRVFFARNDSDYLRYLRYPDKYLKYTTPEEWIFCCKGFYEAYCEEGAALVGEYMCKKYVTMESHREAMEQAFEAKKDSAGTVTAANGTKCKTLTELFEQNPSSESFYLGRTLNLSDFMNEEQIHAYRLATEVLNGENMANRFDILHILARYMDGTPSDGSSIDEEIDEYLKNFSYPDGIETEISKNGYGYSAVKSIYHTMKDLREFLGQAYTDDYCDRYIDDGILFTEENGYLYYIYPGLGTPREYTGRDNDTYLLLYQDENELRFLRVMHMTDWYDTPIQTIREYFGITVMKKTDAGWRVDNLSGF